MGFRNKQEKLEKNIFCAACIQSQTKAHSLQYNGLNYFLEEFLNIISNVSFFYRLFFSRPTQYFPNEAKILSHIFQLSISLSKYEFEVCPVLQKLVLKKSKNQQNTKSMNIFQKYLCSFRWNFTPLLWKGGHRNLKCNGWWDIITGWLLYPKWTFFFVVSRAEQIRQATKRCWCHFGCGIFSSRKINWNKSPCWNSFSFYPFWKDWWPQARLTQPDWTLFWFKYIWTRPQGYQGCQNNWKDTRSIILMCSCPKYLAQIEQTSKSLIKSRKSIQNDWYVMVFYS